MIKVKSLSKSYQEHLVLDNIDFEVNRGEIFGIVGVNGSGKSTIISIIAKEQAYDSGEVVVDSEKICYVPQKMVFFEHLSVRANLELFASGIYSKSETREKIKEISKKFSLDAELGKIVKNISEGNRRKLNIAISFLKDGEVYLLDEPIVNIDYLSRKKIEDVLKGLRDEGRTVLVVSHHRNFLESVCDSVLFLENGRQEYVGELDEKILERL